MSYEYDKYVFDYIIENNIIYLCMCDDNSKRRIPFAFLEDIKQKFIDTYGSRAQTAIAFSFNEEFSKVLKKQLEFFNSPSADAFASINTKLDETKNVMIQNIEMVLERGEKLEILVDKTEELHQQAFIFQKSAKNMLFSLLN